MIKATEVIHVLQFRCQSNIAHLNAAYLTLLKREMNEKKLLRTKTSSIGLEDVYKLINEFDEKSNIIIIKY